MSSEAVEEMMCPDRKPRVLLRSFTKDGSPGMKISRKGNSFATELSLNVRNNEPRMPDVPSTSGGPQRLMKQAAGASTGKDERLNFLPIGG